MKIAYCLNSIRYVGGVSRITIVKANAFSEIPENEVFIIVTDNKKGILTEELNSQVHLIDLDVNYYDDDWKSKWHNLKGIIFKRCKHRKRLEKALRDIQPDIVISVNQSEKHILPSIKGKWKTIREFHLVSDYRKRFAFTFFDKVMAWMGDFYDQHFTLKKYDHIVVLTNEDKEMNWKGWEKVSVIPNPRTFQCNSHSSLEKHIVMSAGRLSGEKNYIDLIEAFGMVVNKHPDWTLEIYGEGPERKLLEKKIISLHLDKNISLKGLSTNIRENFLNASIAAFTSLYEGFLLSIVEAMECGVPVVSYATPCGPRDIISDGQDGYLVEMGDKSALADRLCQLIEDSEKRKQMGQAARKKAQDFAIENIMKQWQTLFESTGNADS
jgi:glycosyltransferase involved in cell wall biosynthesis